MGVGGDGRRILFSLDYWLEEEPLSSKAISQPEPMGVEVGLPPTTLLLLASQRLEPWADQAYVAGWLS